MYLYKLLLGQMGFEFEFLAEAGSAAGVPVGSE
jgi:hypothetical protein